MGTGGRPADDCAGDTPAGVRAGVAIHGAGNCPVVAASIAHDGPLTGINWTHVEDTHTEEFRARDPDAVDRTDAVPAAASVVELGDERVYRYDRPRDGECPCRIIEELDCPIADARAEDGVLVVTLHLPDLERLRDVVSALDGIAERVEVRYLVHGAASGDAAPDRTLVDRGRLTDRQCEVLGIAYRMGYFERPREANASAVAEALDIAPSTFAEHLAAAQRKLLEETLAGA
ncbi:helix-turn-helix domain-containing protein [Halobaculum rubrum]|uniref:helix-turn-helix domain-containing protein n=1 Tax=Halobaculum rubrum TaxID=2872158 RepID=UPI001CA3A95B|nr:helix-turn-helix domain-containing protein [Halobaculum rubrum]QZY00429.1 helix-turn-helix domain-containing protein [Halobaculum rubrum]